MRVRNMDSLAVALLVVAFGRPALAEDLLLGFRLPTAPTVEHLLGTTTEGGDLIGPAPGATACESAEPRPVRLPADDGPHNEASYLEWWWWYGTFTTEDGRRMAAMLLLASKPWGRIIALDYALTDLSDGSFHYGREPLIWGVPGVSPRGGVSASGRHARAEGGSGGDVVQLEVDGYALDLVFTSVKPPALYFGDGFTNLYCNNASMYSRPGMQINGTLTHAGRTVAVAGSGNLDHMWGFDLGLEIANWDWVALHLDDGRDAVLLNARLVQGGQNVAALGYVSGADGSVTPLHRHDFAITPTRWWQRDALCRYPVGFDVRLLDEELHLEAFVDESEVAFLRAPLAALTLTGWSTYWDGPVDVMGDTTGIGFIDMGRYCLG